MDIKVLEQVKKSAIEIHNMLCHEMDVTDTYDWHSEAKYYNADLNALAMLARVLWKETESVINEHMEEE